MPGLVGFTDKRQKSSIGTLHAMKGLMWGAYRYLNAPDFSDELVYAGQTKLRNINQLSVQEKPTSRYVSWLDGELYNLKELESKYSIQQVDPAHLFTEIYSLTGKFEFLRHIDGYFSAALYDRVEKRVHLITDRYGFKPLYWGVIDGDLMWSSELKGFLGHNAFTIRIDERAVGQFLSFGHLLENQSWFSDIQLLPPSAVLSFDVTESTHTIARYWSWHDLKPASGWKNERELSDEIGRLFKESVRKRVSTVERIGIALSGGLDSRAILAAVPDELVGLYSFTFGVKDCDDLRIARMASSVKGTSHHELYLTGLNWLEPRIPGVWTLEASCSLADMHGIEFLTDYRNSMDVCLNGFAGDLAMGGSYLRRYSLGKKISSNLVKRITNTNFEITRFDEWYQIEKTDPYFINNRVRRFTTSGLEMMGKLVEVRIPFWDNHLIEFIYGLPDHLRFNSHIYKKMLLSHFSSYFRSIPWQKTNRPISDPDWLRGTAKVRNRLTRVVSAVARRIGRPLRDRRAYAHYADWLTQEPAKSILENLLLSKNPRYSQYLSKAVVQEMAAEHMKRRADFSKELCLTLTLELWLQQLLDSRFRKCIPFD